MPSKNLGDAKRAPFIKRIRRGLTAWYYSKAEGIYQIMMLLVLLAAIMVSVSGIWYPFQSLAIWTAILIILMFPLYRTTRIMELGGIPGIFVFMIAVLFLIIGWGWFLISGADDGSGSGLWSHITHFLLGSPRK